MPKRARHGTVVPNQQQPVPQHTSNNQSGPAAAYRDPQGSAAKQNQLPSGQCEGAADAIVQRPSRPLALALSCSLCRDLLKEANSVPCGHTFCYDCIMGHVTMGGDHNVCPVPGCGKVLGPHPINHGKLRYDFSLDSLVSQIFPRPSLDAALRARREQREGEARRAMSMQHH